MDSAGELTVQSLSAEAWKAPIGGCQRTFAHDVALRPLTMRKEHTPAGWLDL
jgi:hypothetical protein